MRTETKRISDLVPAEYNPRRITDRALAGLRESIQRFGLVQPIIWNERTGNVVGGHQRMRVLQDEGAEETTVIVVDLPEEEERVLNVSLNNPRIAGEFTDDVEPLLRGMAAKDEDEFRALLLNDLAVDLGVEIVPPEPLQDDGFSASPEPDPVSRPGDIYQLGVHRLLCGDATDASSVLRLFAAGGEPWLMVTDPPYGVAYDPAWRNRVLDRFTETVGEVANDDRADWSDALALFPGDVAYVWHGGLHAAEVLLGLATLQLEVRAQIVWAKQHLVLSRGAYHWQHEPCWYAVRKGRSARWAGDRKQTTLWEIKNRSWGGEFDDADTTHGTQKPLECMARPMRHHGKAGDVVYDPFVGSGTSIIAAEIEGRRCVACALLPGYVDMARRRWAEFVHGAGADWQAETPAV